MFFLRWYKELKRGKVMMEDGADKEIHGVGKLQSGRYKMNPNTWAQDYSTGSGATDVYIQNPDADGNILLVFSMGQIGQHSFRKNWNPGDFVTDRQKSDAAAWKTKHDLNAQRQDFNW